MFADDTKMGGKTADLEIIQPDLLKTAAGAARNDMNEVT